MRLVRIGLVIDRLDPARGGAEAYLLGLARFLVSRGHEVHHLAQRFGSGVDAGARHPVSLPFLPRALRDSGPGSGRPSRKDLGQSAASDEPGWRVPSRDRRRANALSP